MQHAALVVNCHSCLFRHLFQKLLLCFKLGRTRRENNRFGQKLLFHIPLRFSARNSQYFYRKSRIIIFIMNTLIINLIFDNCLHFISGNSSFLYVPKKIYYFCHSVWLKPIICNYLLVNYKRMKVVIYNSHTDNR